MADQTKTASLWTPRTVEDTQKLYADWADTYDDDVTSLNYVTPDRIARALLAQTSDRTRPVLDFGCGTGLSGQALKRHGFTTIDGTDISPEMLDRAQAKTVEGILVYRHIWLSDPAFFNFKSGAYSMVVATGVVSLGAAGPEMLGILVGALARDGLLAFSYNNPTVADPRYADALDKILSDGIATLLFREHGPHLSAQVTGSDVIVLRRR
ncbi:methyltransferase domain-containing protein [Octadecabacter sp.]|nr:methyltransferase domain-containing protein [Octadecabacter sp.]